MNDGDDPRFADKFITRGWDYFGLTWKSCEPISDLKKLSIYARLQYFLDDGILQGEAENYFAFENADEAKERASYDGLSVLFRYDYHIFGDRAKLALKYTTGYQDVFENNTLRFEATVSAWYTSTPARRASSKVSNPHGWIMNSWKSTVLSA